MRHRNVFRKLSWVEASTNFNPTWWSMAPVSLFPAVRATLFGAAVPGITTINQDVRNPIWHPIPKWPLKPLFNIHNFHKVTMWFGQVAPQNYGKFENGRVESRVASPVLSAAVAAVEVLLALAAVVEEPPQKVSGSWITFQEKKNTTLALPLSFLKLFHPHPKHPMVPGLVETGSAQGPTLVLAPPSVVWLRLVWLVTQLVEQPAEVLEESVLHYDIHRENGSTLGMVPVIINPRNLI